jgi:hypothetical protein
MDMVGDKVKVEGLASNLGLLGPIMRLSGGESPASFGRKQFLGIMS